MQLLTLVPHGPWDDIPSEDVEGASWEDVVSEPKGVGSTADIGGWSPTAAAAGIGGYLQWGKDRLLGGKHKGALLRAWASGELLRAWSAEQQQWIEPAWHRLCDSEEPYGEDDGLGGLRRLPQSQKWRAKKQAMSRRWSHGDLVGVFVGSRGRSPDGGAEQGRGAWCRADREQEQQLLRQPLINPEFLGSDGDVQQQQQGQGEEHWWGVAAPSPDGGMGSPSAQPAVSASLSAEPLARRNAHFRGDRDGSSTDKDTPYPGAVPDMGGFCSRAHMGTDQTTYQQQASFSPGVNGARSPSHSERFDAQYSMAGQIQEQAPSPPLQPPQHSALPPHSPRVPSRVGVHAHVRTQAPQGSCSLSPASSGWGDGKRGSASRRRRSAAGWGIQGADAQLSPRQTSSRPGVSDAGMGASSRSQRRSHAAQR
ncbi:hypothetical protein DUNSADRAFT_15138 [Dunaliella salina]|uniref:Uncharacterized protein n=1 Tax=Dunaliella salina TaxID=3046 RepID=A0ABQ7H273_DUNSA|nr:hypothetical protein DUNSADRAFT_15138 [Dunaliella salina]|eukprot:KAF5840937.1 hypothetical protein DUNSADRAFT_15138 [Dunaliella salina]